MHTLIQLIRHIIPRLPKLKYPFTKPILMKIKYLPLLFLFTIPVWSGAQDLTDSLTIELEQLWKESNLPGFAVALITTDNILYTRGFGYANIDTKTPFSLRNTQ